MRRISFPVISETQSSPILSLTKSKTMQANLVASLPLKQIETLNLNVPGFDEMKKKACLAGRIRRFSDNQNTSMALPKKSDLPERSISNSLLELSKVSGGGGAGSNVTTNRVSIRKHTSKPLKHRKTAKLLGIATLAFAFTWMPYWVYVYMLKFKFNDYLINGLIKSTAGSYLLVKCLKNSFYLNYILNPIFYSFVNKRFRQNLVALYQKIVKFFCCVGSGDRCCFVRQNRNNSKITTCSAETYSTNLKRNGTKSLLQTTCNNKFNPVNKTTLNGNNLETNRRILGVFSKRFAYFTTCCSRKSRNPLNADYSFQTSHLQAKPNINDTKI